MRLRIITIIPAIALLAATSCSNDDPVADVGLVRMPLHLYIPATDATAQRPQLPQPLPFRGSPVDTADSIGSPAYVETRALGDPGTFENFKLPEYAYIYIVTKDEQNNTNVTMSTSLLTGKWTKKRYEGRMASANDSVFEYNGTIDVILPYDRQAEGTVYAALSPVRLDGLPEGNEGTVSKMKSEEAVQNQRFKMTDAVRSELQNIYSTPYNYRIDDTYHYNASGKYYGTFTNMNTTTPSIDIVLYHIASKLDINWNVPTANQSSVRLSAMTITVPEPSECYIFKPLENTSSTTHDETIDINIGNQWYGRAYRYVLPVTDKNSNYTFKVAITNAVDDKQRSESITAGAIDKTQPFAPWMVGKIRVGQ